MATLTYRYTDGREARSYGLTQTTAPSALPLTIARLRHHVGTAAVQGQDEYLRQLLAAAVDLVERRTGRQLITATWSLYLESFPLSARSLWLPKPELQAITSVVYTDANGESQSWSASNYETSSGEDPARLRPVSGVAWPATTRGLAAVTITYTAGYGDADDDVPEGIKLALLQIVDDWFWRRSPPGELGPWIDVMLGPWTIGEDYLQYAAD